jgi:hypothetical protein
MAVTGCDGFQFDHQCANCKTIPKNPLLFPETLARIRRLSMKLLKD